VLRDPVRTVVGDRTAKILRSGLAIETVGDLLRHYPRRYAERGELTDLASLQLDEYVTVMAEIASVSNRPMRGRRGSLLVVEVTDGRGRLSLTFFNQSWRERELRTGRHGLFSCYEAFIHLIDSMFNQHAKWLKVTREIGWRRPIASLNYLLTSHVWRQDHNGFSHQDPGFIDHVVNKKAEVVRVYLPPDTNTLLSTVEHCLASKNYVNVIVAGKQPCFDWLTPDEAGLHCARGVGIWDWASTDHDGDPDVVIGCAGDVPTLEALAAVAILREKLPELKIRFINVVDLMRLQDDTEHPHGLSHRDFDTLFTSDKPIVFAYHGYPWLIHRLTYRRTNHDNLHVRGYKEEGTTSTAFDMVMMNDMDRFHLVIDVIDNVPSLRSSAALLRQEMVDARAEAKRYTRLYGDDIPSVRDWTWTAATGSGDGPGPGALSDTSADFSPEVESEKH